MHNKTLFPKLVSSIVAVVMLFSSFSWSMPIKYLRAPAAEDRGQQKTPDYNIIILERLISKFTDIDDEIKYRTDRDNAIAKAEKEKDEIDDWWGLTRTIWYSGL